jgi:transposase-like protein
MDLKEQIILEYLEQGCGYRKLPAKYGISRTTICKWVQIYQGIHHVPRTGKQEKYYIRDMNLSPYHFYHLKHDILRQIH